MARSRRRHTCGLLPYTFLLLSTAALLIWLGAMSGSRSGQTLTSTVLVRWHQQAPGSGAGVAAAAGSSSNNSSSAASGKLQQYSAGQLPPAKGAFKVPLAGTPHPPGKYFSQDGLGQDKYIDGLLQGLTGGFFVESGAFDGVEFSNTLFLEASRNWTGLLVEANPALYSKVISSSNRTGSVAINACLSPTGKREQLEFVLGGPIGGLSGYMTAAHRTRVHREIEHTPGGAASAGPTNTGQSVNVTCWPLHSMMAALGRTRIDYWSLDTEGSEAAILNATDFTALDIRVITIEFNDKTARSNVEQVMATKPYKLAHVLSYDLVYVKNE